MIQVAIQHLEQRRFGFTQVCVSKRYTDGNEASVNDNTVLIRANLSERYYEWVSMLDNLISAIQGLGFPGRVEIIDDRAAAGPRTFAPKLSDQQQQHWPEICQDVVHRLSSFGLIGL